MTGIRDRLAAALLPAGESTTGPGVLTKEMEEDGDQRTLILRVDSKYDAFIHFGADHLFAEYSREWGKFGVVSLFDRRPTLETTEAAKLATFFFLWLCRSLAKVQRSSPKVFPCRRPRSAMEHV